MDSGVATRPIKNFDEYSAQLQRYSFRSGLTMKPVFAKAKTQPVRVVYAEGEDERVLRATQVVLEEKIARPILVGRPSVVEARIKRFGLSIRAGHDFDLVNPEDDPRYRANVETIVAACKRHGKTPGFMAGDDAWAKDYLARGFRIIAYGVDSAIFRVGLQAGIAGMRRLVTG